MLQVEQKIPFNEIVPGAEVRVAVINGVQYLSIRDVIMCVCGKDGNTAGAVWRNLSQDKKDEVQPYVLNFQFSGPGQSSTPVITFPGALKMIMFLPGDAAKMHRSTMAAILTRYFAGDKSLIQEIEANAVSESPVCQLARDDVKAIDNTPSLGDELVHKRKLDQLEIEERAAAVIKTKITCYQQVCTDTTMDERAKEMFKEAILSNLQPVEKPRDDCRPKEQQAIDSAALEASYQAKLQEKDEMIIELRSKVAPKTYYVLENMKNAFVICKESPDLVPIAEEVLYDAFLQSIPRLEHVPNLEEMFSICNPGKKLSVYYIKLFREHRRRVCQDNFCSCLEMIGGKYAMHGRSRLWNNVVPRAAPFFFSSVTTPR